MSRETGFEPDYEIIRVWSAHGTNDDGRPHMEWIGVFRDKTVALDACATAGARGGQGIVTHREALLIGDKAFLLAQVEPVDLNVNEVQQRADIKKRALKKLTPTERAVLGV